MNARIAENPFDAVLCVHPFAAMMYTELRRRYESKTPAYFVATDYTASPGVDASQLDGYFVPHRMLFSEFIRCGIGADQLFASGIPIRETFYQEVSPYDARRALNLPTEGRMLLLSGGSMGAGHMEKAALKLVEALPKDAFLTVICGKNEKTYQALLPFAGERMHVVGYTEEIDLYMSAADLYITKPGGLTTTEAIAKRTPLLFINAVPGCESRNFDFLTHSGVAVGAGSWREVISKSCELLSKPEALEEQKHAMEKFLDQKATEVICRQLQKALRPLTPTV